MTDRPTIPADRSSRRRSRWTRWPTASRRRPRTGPRSARPARRRCSTPTAPGSIMDLPQFSIMPAGLDDWEPIWRRRDVSSRRSTSPGCSTWSGCTSVAAGAAAAAVPVAAEEARACRRKATTSASRPGCSRSGCAAPAATTSGRCRGSATPTPTRSGPTWRRFEHTSCPGRGGATRAARARPGAARPCPPGTCSPAPTATSTSSRTRCGCTAAARAPKAELPDLKMSTRNVGTGRRRDRSRCASLRAAARHGRGPGRGRRARSCRSAADGTRTSNAFDAEGCDAGPA